jgi:hypothetical protein
MEVKITYSKTQLELAVKHIARNNNHFQGKKDYIRDSILDHMERIACNPDSWMGSSMGYYLIGDREDEGIDCDENRIHFELWIDPSLGYDIDIDDYAEKIWRGEPNKESY